MSLGGFAKRPINCHALANVRNQFTRDVFQGRFTENFYILGPQDPSAAPFTHFRHGGNVTNVAYLDGHVEPKVEEFVASPTSWDQAANNMRQQMRLGYVSANSVDAYRAE